MSTDPTLARWNVRIVRNGEHYGRNNCLTHDENDPLIEFFDMTVRPDLWGDEGYFVSRYYLSTLLEDANELRETGLCLHGGGRYDDEINVEPVAMNAIVDMLVSLPEANTIRLENATG